MQTETLPQLLNRAAAALETPGDLTPQEISEIAADLVVASNTVLTAIARINGEWDHAQLVAFGPLSTNTEQDVLQILQEVPSRGIVAPSLKRSVASIRIVIDTDDGIPAYWPVDWEGEVCPLLTYDQAFTLLRNAVPFVAVLADPKCPHNHYEMLEQSIFHRI